MTFDNILFPVDFSRSCSALKAEVESIAKRFRSTVTLLHTYDIPPACYGMGDTRASNTEWRTQIAGEAQKRLDNFGLDLPADKVKRLSVDGQPAAEICEFVRAHPVDLVAMAAHGYGATQGLMLGSVTVKVLHKINVPVWLRPVKPSQTGGAGISKIICGIDFETETVSMLLHAKQMAEAFGATMTLVHSLAWEEIRTDKYFNSGPSSFSMALAEQQIALLQSRAGTKFAVKVTASPISRALAESAAGDQASLILIGSGRSQKFLGRFRTHTYDLLNEVTCPVFDFCQARADNAPASYAMAAR